MKDTFRDRQPLNTMDRLMAAVDQRLRSRGRAGLMLQSQIWLLDRLDAAELRETLERFRLVYPVIASVKVDRCCGLAPYWRFDANAPVELHTHELASDDVAAVRQAAEQLLNTPLEVERRPPIRFHLLRRPRLGDVFIVQWSHALMDGLAGGLALQAIDRLWLKPCTAPPRAPAPEPDEVLRVVNSTPLRRRLRSLWTLFNNLYQPLPVQFGQRAHPQPPRIRVRVAYRLLDAEQTRAVNDRVQHLCGIADPAPVLLACALRAAADVPDEAPFAGRTFYVQAPVSMRPPGAAMPVFRNMQSYVRFAIARPQLTDFSCVLERLRSELRDQIRCGADIGYWLGGTLLSHSRRVASAVILRMCSRLAFLFGYHGRLDLELSRFCGAEVEMVYGGIPTSWSAPGVVIASGFSRQQLFLTASYEYDRATELQMEAFLDRFVAELLRLPHRISRAGAGLS
jgi:hypothetical protein